MAGGGSSSAAVAAAEVWLGAVGPPHHAVQTQRAAAMVCLQHLCKNKQQHNLVCYWESNVKLFLSLTRTPPHTVSTNMQAIY